MNHPLVDHKLTVLRDKNTPSSTFRELVSELVMLEAYEATRDIEVVDKPIETPVAPMIGKHIAAPAPIIVPVLRAGLGMLDGMTKMIPSAEVGFLGMKRDEENPIKADTVVVDEMSMVDIFLMRALLRAVKPGARLILVGDADQLPSVGAGNVLRDILESDAMPVVWLKEIYRQEGESMIVLNAHRINAGEMPVTNSKGTDFFLERCETGAQAAQRIVDLARRRLPAYAGVDPLKDIQVLSPTKKGESGVYALNIALQNCFNPPRAGGEEVTFGDTAFRPGDKVMQTRNDYDMEWRRRVNLGWEDGKGVFNGDVGFVTAVDTENHALTVRFDDEKDAEYTGQQLEDLDLAYCLSVHKSQGSEFPVVILPVVYGPMMLLTRNLFYTALTRARKLVVLVGREEIIRQMVENDHIMKRYTTLSDRLRQVATMLPKVDVFGAPIEE